jgi:hypothetical protein
MQLLAKHIWKYENVTLIPVKIWFTPAYNSKSYTPAQQENIKQQQYIEKW